MARASVRESWRNASSARLTRTPARSGPGSADGKPRPYHRVHWPETSMGPLGQGSSHRVAEDLETLVQHLHNLRPVDEVPSSRSVHRRGRWCTDHLVVELRLSLLPMQPQGRFHRDADAGGVTLPGSRSRARD